MPWFVYIILCENGSFYTGITNNIEKRWTQHIDGKGAKFFRTTSPKEIVYTEQLENKSNALKREAFIKKLKKYEKNELIGVSGLQENSPADTPKRSANILTL